MPTAKTNKVSRQNTDDVIAQVVGLFGDPANQDGTGHTVKLSPGRVGTGAFDLISWNGITEDLRSVLFWSRLLLCEIYVPYDPNGNFTRLALVARPRAMWLYEYAGGKVADFIGTTDDPALMGFTTHHIIPDVKPAYRRGDTIRVGMLSAPIRLKDFADKTIGGTDIYVKEFGETFDGTATRTATLSGSADFQNVTILGGDFGKITQTEILYYDKNVDARTRYGGSGKSTEETVDVSLCIGGVQQTYRITGTRIA